MKIGEEIYKEIGDFCKKKRQEDAADKPMLMPPPEVPKLLPTKMDEKVVNEDEEREIRKMVRLNTVIQRRQNFRKKSTTVKYEKHENETIDLDNEDYKRLVRMLQEKYKDFNASFPIFIRWTVQTGDFYPGALRKFLAVHAATRLKDMEEFLRLQTKYAVYTYKEKYPHWDTSRVAQMSSDIMKSLMKEDKEFKEVNEEVKKDMEEDQKMRNAYMKEKMLEKFKAMQAASS